PVYSLIVRLPLATALFLHRSATTSIYTLSLHDALPIFTALTIDTEKRLKWFIAVFVFCQIFRVLEPLYLNITQGYWGSATHLQGDRKSTRLNSSHVKISYAVFCLKKKTEGRRPAAEVHR